MFRFLQPLEYKALQNCMAASLSRFGNTCSHLTHNSSVITANQINLPRFNTLPRGSRIFRLLYGSTSLGVAFPSLLACKVLHAGFGLPSTHCYGASARTFTSEVPAAMTRIGHAGRAHEEKSSGDASLSKIFDKTRSRTDALGTHIKCSNDGVTGALSEPSMQKTASNSKISSIGDGDQVTSTPNTSTNSPCSTKKGNPRQRSRSKKKEKNSVAATPADGVQSKGSETVSGLKNPENAKNIKPPQTSESDSGGTKFSEAGNGSIMSKSNNQAKKTASKRGKSLNKKGPVNEKSDEGLAKLHQIADHSSSSTESPNKQKSNTSGKPKHQSRGALKLLYPPTGKSVVVVESVTKARVIQGYLGDMYEVLPSHGHVRDLAARSGSVRPDDDFSMVWEVPPPAWTHLKSIKVALSGAENLILASDPDREGEAIAWHILEMLQQQDALCENVYIARVVFHEITESSIKNALQAPRTINQNLVNAYLARRALDYLIGFNISPLLWKKLPGCQSAGRVQSAALSLISDREMEIDKFKVQEYWSVGATFKKEEPTIISLPSMLMNYSFQKLNRLSISSHAEAKDIEAKIGSLTFTVVGSKRSKMRKNPPPPYITSTLQQDAGNKLNFSATNTMKLAQKLYEGVQLSDGMATGLITYMRTDGLHVSKEAASEIRSLITERYGDDFASESAGTYFKKVKNAQEAHEAIRPTDIRRLPSTLTEILDEDSLKLYSLIWSRTMACQMQPASIDQLRIDIGTADKSATFQSTCSRVGFLGYQAVYKDLETEAFKSVENDEKDGQAIESLSTLKVGDLLCLDKIELKQHHTQPPPRYSEASLVKKLEELGIGRPSTYAPTLRVLKDRNYVTVKSRVLYPEFRGRMVSAFLSHNFSEVADYSFTADMETQLDNVSGGLTEWRGLLKDYWTRFSGCCNRAGSIHIHQVEKMLEEKFGDFLFSCLPNESRECPSCSEGTLIFKVSRHGQGYFIGCDQHPKCKYIARTIYGGDDDDDEAPPQMKTTTVEEPKLLGLNPGSNEKILLKNGPYGFYVQLGEDRKGYSPKRSSVSQIKDVSSITLEDALELLRFPLTLGKHPEDGKPVVLKLAKNGYIIKHRGRVATVPKKLGASDITMNEALELLVSKGVKRYGRHKSKPKVEQSDEEAVEAM